VAQQLPDPSVDTSAAQAAIQQAEAGLSNSQSEATQQSLSSGSGSPADQKPRRGSVTSVPTAVNLQGFMRGVSQAWKTLRTANEFTGPFNDTLDAYNSATVAYATGDLPVNPQVDQAREFARSLKDRLSNLTQTSTNNWEIASGENEFQPSSFDAAEAYLDGWSQQLASIKIDIEDEIPRVVEWEHLELADAIRKQALDGLSTEDSNAIVLENDVVPDLRACLERIERIQNHVKEARLNVSNNKRALRDARSGKGGADSDTAGGPATVHGPMWCWWGGHWKLQECANKGPNYHNAGPSG